MTFFNKIKWFLGILLVFGLIIMTNLIDRNNFVKVRDSISTIYEDRLIVKDLIFDISKGIHQKEIAVAKTDTLFFIEKNKGVNKEIQDLVDRYAQTKLTSEERKAFQRFELNLDKLLTAESRYMASRFTDKTNTEKQLSVIKDNLEDLSQIQIKEGHRQVSISKQAVDTVELFTQIEIYLLVFLAVAIQIVVIYNPKPEA
jgi:hypothetical protein